jgi:hypothetical protein
MPCRMRRPTTRRGRRPGAPLILDTVGEISPAGFSPALQASCRGSERTISAGSWDPLTVARRRPRGSTGNPGHGNPVMAHDLRRPWPIMSAAQPLRMTSHNFARPSNSRTSCCARSWRVRWTPRKMRDRPRRIPVHSPGPELRLPCSPSSPRWSRSSPPSRRTSGSTAHTPGKSSAGRGARCR